MLNLFKKSNPVTVEQIHEEFNSAGEALLHEAMKMLNEKGPIKSDKINRLKQAGFIGCEEVVRHEGLIKTKETAELISKYMVRYPNNKFITEEQVKKICTKYGLVCGPIERYRGFVPEQKLSLIERFSLNREDVAINMVKILGAWNTGAVDFLFRWRGAAHIHRELGLDLIPQNHPSLYWHGNNLFGIWRGSDNVGGGYVSSFKIYGNDKMMICAPRKEMDLKGLEKIGAVFQSSLTVTNPKDPVVLHPCKGGYLILAAWGDEASDELVVNERHN